MDIFAQRLRELRKQNMLSQREIADILGVKEKAYQHYEYGNVKPKVETLVKMAEIFEVSTDFLFGLSDKAEMKQTLFAKDIKKSISTILRFERKKLGFTQKQMAEQLGMGYTTYQQYENRKRMPINESLLHMAQYFHLDLDTLLGRNE